MSEKIPYSTQEITKEDIGAVESCLQSGWIAGTGPRTEEFEEAVASYTGYSYAVAVSSATAGLHIAYHLLFASQNHITMPSLTFVATANMAKALGKTPVFADINSDLIVDGLDVGVSYAGYPVVNSTVADDAHSLFPGMADIKHNIVSVISFHPVKPITTAEGGMILTNDSYLASQARMIRSHGRDSNGECVTLGYNYRMPDICAALGVSQLKRAKSNLEHRKEIAQYYREELSGVCEIQLPPYHSYHTYHLFPLRIKNEKRDEFRKRLSEVGIGTQIHYLPVHLHPLYKNNAWAIGELKNTENTYKQLVSIPMFSSLTMQNAKRITQEIKSIFHKWENTKHLQNQIP